MSIVAVNSSDGSPRWDAPPSDASCSSSAPVESKWCMNLRIYRFWGFAQITRKWLWLWRLWCLKWDAQSKDLFTPSDCVNATTTLLWHQQCCLSLKRMESLEYGLQPHSGVTPLISMRTLLLASSHICGIIDSDTRCKQAPSLSFLALAYRKPYFCTLRNQINRQLFENSWPTVSKK